MQLRNKENKKIEYNDERKRYVSLDFEIMESNFRASVCSVAAVVIENGKIKDKFYSLVCPPSKNESYYCVKTHGLHYSDVKNSPKFPEVWSKIDKMIDGCPIIAHNAGFERSCINSCADFFETNNEYLYFDTVAMSKKCFPYLSNHRLDTICENVNHKLKHHHNALDDAIAAAKIFIKLIDKYNKINE